MSSEEERLVQKVYKRLNLNTNDGEIVYNDPSILQQGEPEARWKCCIAGRLSTKKVINFQIFKNIIASFW